MPNSECGVWKLAESARLRTRLRAARKSMARGALFVKCSAQSKEGASRDTRCASRDEEEQNEGL